MARILLDRHRPRRDKAEQQDGTLKGAFAVFHISIPENYRDKLVETDDRGESDRRLVRPTCREGGVSDMTRGGERKRRFNLKIALIYISQLGPR